MSVVRMNSTLPDDVVKILKKKTKTGEKSAYIAEAVRQYDVRQSAQQVVRELMRDYSARAEAQTGDWDSTLMDGLDED